MSSLRSTYAPLHRVVKHNERQYRRSRPRPASTWCPSPRANPARPHDEHRTSYPDADVSRITLPVPTSSSCRAAQSSSHAGASGLSLARMRRGLPADLELSGGSFQDPLHGGKQAMPLAGLCEHAQG
jgi:hypothetical protein